MMDEYHLVANHELVKPYHHNMQLILSRWFEFSQSVHHLLANYRPVNPKYILSTNSLTHLKQFIIGLNTFMVIRTKADNYGFGIKRLIIHFIKLPSVNAASTLQRTMRCKHLGTNCNTITHNQTV